MFSQNAGQVERSVSALPVPNDELSNPSGDSVPQIQVKNSGVEVRVVSKQVADLACELCKAAQKRLGDQAPNQVVFRYPAESEAPDQPVERIIYKGRGGHASGGSPSHKAYLAAVGALAPKYGLIDKDASKTDFVKDFASTIYDEGFSVLYSNKSGQQINIERDHVLDNSGKFQAMNKRNKKSYFEVRLSQSLRDRVAEFRKQVPMNLSDRQRVANLKRGCRKSGASQGTGAKRAKPAPVAVGHAAGVAGQIGQAPGVYSPQTATNGLDLPSQAAFGVDGARRHIQAVFQLELESLYRTLLDGVFGGNSTLESGGFDSAVRRLIEIEQIVPGSTFLTGDFVGYRDAQGNLCKGTLLGYLKQAGHTEAINRFNRLASVSNVVPKDQHERVSPAPALPAGLR